MTDLRLPARLRTTESSATREPAPGIASTPALPPINFAAVGKTAPALPETPSTIPTADVIVVCWAEAEWAPLVHVFTSGAQSMSYSARGTGTWSGWKAFSEGVPSGVTLWGYYRLVTVGDQRVLLFKSNVHLDEGPTNGPSYVAQLFQVLVRKVTPKLILSTGTAGGARLTDPVGTINITSAGTLFEPQLTPDSWPRYANGWTPNGSVINNSGFATLLFAVPTTTSDLTALAAQFNKAHKTSYPLSVLDPDRLCVGAAAPALNDLTPNGSLLTATSFVVANTSGNYAAYACVEMDDAIIGQVCKELNVSFGFVRNISDPIQNAALPSSIQGAWGSFIYEAYGFYTSYNGALAAWAILAA